MICCAAVENQNNNNNNKNYLSLEGQRIPEIIFILFPLTWHGFDPWV